MKKSKQLPNPIGENSQLQSKTECSPESDQSQLRTETVLESTLKLYGPTLGQKELEKVTRVCRAQTFVKRKSDPSYPQGAPLYDCKNSPNFFWTHEAIAWLESRSNKFRNKQKENQL